MLSLKEVKIPKGVRENIKEVKDLKSNNFFRLPPNIQVNILNEGIDKFRIYIKTRELTPELSDYMKLFEDIYRETGDSTVTPYLQLYDAMKSRNGSKLSRDVLETLREDDPETFAAYLKYPGEEVANIPGFDFYDYKRTGNGVIKSAEPTTGALSSNPINNAPPVEASPGALTNPDAFEVGPKRLSYQSFDDAELNAILAKGSKEAEANAYTGEEPPIADYGTPITSPGVHVTFINAEGKPVDLTSEEIAKFKPNSVSASSEAKVAEGTAKAEAKAETKGGALTGNGEKPAEPSKGMFKKMLGWVRNHPKISWGVGGTTALGLLSGIGISQADKIAKALEAGETPSRNTNEEPEVFDNVNYRVWENYTPDYLNEEYTPGKIPSHIPQDNLPSVKESAVAKKTKSSPQVVNAPEPVNNATADYVRAAYNSYIPSDAGRAYQKAIYGDPLELDRMRLQQQQQKWRDFVMRSGQSPAELVQRGLMPYDALQYV